MKNKKQYNKVQQSYGELEKAVEVFKTAITLFQQTYDPDSVGLDEWCENLDDTMVEIEEDVNEHFEVDED